jgi:hypothetical protein
MWSFRGLLFIHGISYSQYHFVINFIGYRAEEEGAGKNTVVEGQEVEEVSIHTQLGEVEDLEEEVDVHTEEVVLGEGVDSKQEEELEELGVVFPSATLWKWGQMKTRQSSSLRVHETC